MAGKMALRGWRVTAVALIIGVCGTGCSQFRTQKRLNLGPFAEDIIAVAGEVQYGLAQNQPIYTREFVGGPEYESLRVHAVKVRGMVRGTIAYAVQLVSLADSDLSGPERAGALADYLDDLLRPVLSAPAPTLHLTVADLDTIIADVRAQESLLGALGAAQPIIDDVAYSAGELFEDTKTALDASVNATRARVDAEHEDIRRADRMLRDAQVATVLNIQWLGAIRLGQAGAVDSLLSREPSLREVIGTHSAPTPKDLRAIEDRMLFKLRALSELRQQLAPDQELYWKRQREIDELAATYNASLRKALIAVVAWSRAHKRLAAGVTDPAKIDVLGIARKAAGSVSPL